MTTMHITFKLLLLLLLLLTHAAAAVATASLQAARLKYADWQKRFVWNVWFCLKFLSLLKGHMAGGWLQLVLMEETKHAFHSQQQKLRRHRAYLYHRHRYRHRYQHRQLQQFPLLPRGLYPPAMLLRRTKHLPCLFFRTMISTGRVVLTIFGVILIAAAMGGC
jgi:hypothetical protein